MNTNYSELTAAVIKNMTRAGYEVTEAAIKTRLTGLAGEEILAVFNDTLNALLDSKCVRSTVVQENPGYGIASTYHPAVVRCV